MGVLDSDEKFPMSQRRLPITFQFSDHLHRRYRPNNNLSNSGERFPKPVDGVTALASWNTDDSGMTESYASRLLNQRMIDSNQLMHFELRNALLCRNRMTEDIGFYVYIGAHKFIVTLSRSTPKLKDNERVDRK